MEELLSRLCEGEMEEAVYREALELWRGEAGEGRPPEELVDGFVALMGSRFRSCPLKLSAAFRAGLKAGARDVMELYFD